MKLFEITNNNSRNLDVAYRDTLSSFTRSPNNKGWSTFERKQENLAITLCVRDWGDWVVPEDAEDDGDYDWNIPTEKNHAGCE